MSIPNTELQAATLRIKVRDLIGQWESYLPMVLRETRVVVCERTLPRLAAELEAVAQEHQLRLPTCTRGDKQVSALAEIAEGRITDDEGEDIVKRARDCIGKFKKRFLTPPATEPNDAPAIVLRGDNKPPLIRGKPARKNPTKAQRRVLKALLDAQAEGSARIMCPELVERTGDPQADKVLRDMLRDQPEYQQVIVTPQGKKNAGYGII